MRKLQTGRKYLQMTHKGLIQNIQKLFKTPTIRKQATWLKIESKIWTDTLPKNTNTWQASIRKYISYHMSSVKSELKLYTSKKKKKKKTIHPLEWPNSKHGPHQMLVRMWNKRNSCSLSTENAAFLLCFSSPSLATSDPRTTVFLVHWLYDLFLITRIHHWYKWFKVPRTTDFKKYLFIWLYWVFVATCGIFNLHCSMQDLKLWHVGSCSPTRKWTSFSWIGSMES